MRSLFASRAVVSFAAGLLVVFNQGHYVAMSLLALTIFGLGIAVGQLGIALFGKRGLAAIESVPTAIIALSIGAIAGLAALQADQATPDVVIQEFEWLVTGWALTSGAFELYLGRRAGFKTGLGRDWGILAGLGLALGAALLVIDTDRTTTVGLFVTYLMVSAVHLGLAAASPKPAVGIVPESK